MVVMTTYADRIRLSLGLDGSSEGKFVRARINDLAQALGVSYTAVAKMLGRDKQFSAVNSAKAAKFLGVDHFWLATGEGKSSPDRAWPYEHFSPEQYHRYLTPAERSENEALLYGKIMMAEKKNDTGT